MVGALRSMADTAGKPITCKAMVAFGVDDLREEDISGSKCTCLLFNSPGTIPFGQEIVVAPPKAGEVRVKVI